MPFVFGKLTNVHCGNQRKTRASKLFGPGSSLIDTRQNILKYDINNIPGHSATEGPSAFGQLTVSLSRLLGLWLPDPSPSLKHVRKMQKSQMWLLGHLPWSLRHMHFRDQRVLRLLYSVAPLIRLENYVKFWVKVTGRNKEVVWKYFWSLCISWNFSMLSQLI